MCCGEVVLGRNLYPWFSDREDEAAHGFYLNLYLCNAHTGALAG